jgi:hypothetical protein
VNLFELGFLGHCPHVEADVRAAVPDTAHGGMARNVYASERIKKF